MNQYLAWLGQSIGAGVTQAVAAVPAEQTQARDNLEQIIAGLTMPGNPVYESLKAVLGQINSLSNYESYGYATFMFVRWKWVFGPFGAIPVPCADVQLRTVPEGTGIPIVTRKSWRRNLLGRVPIHKLERQSRVLAILDECAPTLHR